MNEVVSGIKNFYSYYTISATILQKTPDICTLNYTPCSRLSFASSALDALAFLIVNVAETAFYALAVTFTLGSKSEFKQSLLHTVRQAVVHACSIPVSITGIVCPHTINTKFLDIHSNCSIVTETPDVIKKLVIVLGATIIQNRAPLFADN
jgi:hypothetical protein